MSTAVLKRKSHTLHGTRAGGKSRISHGPAAHWMLRHPVLCPGDTDTPIETVSAAGFSINGTKRNVHGVGRDMRMNSTVRTPFRGVYPVGHGGRNGHYVSQPILLATPPGILAELPDRVAPTVVNAGNMPPSRHKWVHSAGYPLVWVQPQHTGNQVSSYDELYRRRNSEAVLCAPEWDRQNAAKTPQNVSNDMYLIHLTRKCAHPTEAQKPFPYATNGGGSNCVTPPQFLRPATAV